MAEQQTSTTDTPIPASAAASIQQMDDTTSVLPPFSPEAEFVGATPDAAPDAFPVPVPAAKQRRERFSWFADQPMRLTLVVIVGVVALFFAFGLLIIFNATDAAVAALAVIATPVASMVAAYYGITLSIQQVRDEREEKEKANARAALAETAAREADVWAAQMESGLRVAKAKLDAARIPSSDVTKAAGVTDDFF